MRPNRRATLRATFAGIAIASVFVFASCDLDKIIGLPPTAVGFDSTDMALSGGEEVALGGTITIGVTSSSVDLSKVVKRYTSSLPSVISVDSLTGVAFGLAIGTAKLTAHVLAPELGAGVTKSQDVRVRYKGIRVTAPTVTDSMTGLGQSRSIMVQGLNNANELVAGLLASLTLTSSDTTIFRVIGQTIVARKNGSTYVVAVFDNLRDSVLFRVRQVAKSITFPTTDYTATAINANLTIPLTVRDVADSTIPTPTLTWRMNDTTVATVGATTGTLRLKRNDTTRVFARMDTVERGQKIVVAQVVSSLVKLAGTDAQTNTVALLVAIAPAVTALDAGSTAVPNASVTFRVGSGLNATVTDSVKTTDVNGLATLGAWKLGDRAGANTVIATSGSATTTFTATGVAGISKKLAFSVQPTSVAIGAVMAPAVRVAIQDSLGNTVTTATSNVTLAFSNNAGAATLGGTLTVAAVAGIATFSNLTVSARGSGYTLQSSSGALTAATSNGFDAFGMATRLGFLTQLRDVTTGTVISPAVRVAVQDASGATVASATNTVTLSIFTNPGGATLSGTLSVTAVAGVATFSNLTLNQLGTGYVLAAVATGLTTGNSSGFNVVAVGPASKLAFTVQPSNVVAGAANSPSIQVTVQDASGATVTTSFALITLAIDPGSATIGGTVAVFAVNGVATFSNITVTRVGTGYKLTASATSLTGATSNTFNVTLGTANRVSFLQQPTHTALSQTMAPAVTVAVQDAFFNTVTGAAATSVTLSLTGCIATLGGTTTANSTSGVATFSNLSIATQVSSCTLSATATGLTSGTSSAFNIVAATGAVKLGFITNPPTNTTAGTTLGTIQVALQNANGTTVTTATPTTVTLALGANPGSGSLTGTLTASTSGGIATFFGPALTTASTGYTLAATAPGYQPATGSAFNISAGTATKVGFLRQPTTSTAGVPFSPSVQVAVQDAYNNTVTASAASVTLQFSGVGTSGGSFAGPTTSIVSAVSGLATYTGLRVNKSATGYILLATSGFLTSAASSSFNIDRAPASLLAFSTQPSASYPAGTAISVAVQTQDSVGNVFTDPSAAITVSLTGGTAGAVLSGTRTVTPVSGSAAFTNLSVDRSGTLYQLNASATGFANNLSSTFAIVAGSATRLGFVQAPTNTTYGVSISPAVTVAVQDQYGNTVTNATDAVSMAIGTDPIPTTTLSGGGSTAAASGVATFAGLTLNRTSGTGYTIVANAMGLTSATSGSFTMTSPGVVTTSTIINDMARLGDTIYFTHASALKKVHVNGGTVTTITSSSNADRITTDGLNIYWAEPGLTNSGDASVKKLTVATGGVTRLANFMTLLGAGNESKIYSDGINVYFVARNSPATAIAIRSISVNAVDGIPTDLISTANVSQVPNFLLNGGAIYFHEPATGIIRRMTSAGGSVTTLSTTGVTGLYFAVSGTTLYVTDGSGNVRSIANANTAITAVTPTTVISGLGAQYDLAVDGSNLYVHFVNTIRRYAVSNFSSFTDLTTSAAAAPHAFVFGGVDMFFNDLNGRIAKLPK